MVSHLLQSLIQKLRNSSACPMDNHKKKKSLEQTTDRSPKWMIVAEKCTGYVFICVLLKSRPSMPAAKGSK